MSVPDDSVLQIGRPDLRDDRPSLVGLLMVSMLMTRSGDEQRILELAIGSVSSLSRCQVLGLFMDGRWRSHPRVHVTADTRRCVERKLSDLGETEAMLSIPGFQWARPYSLKSRDSHAGFLLVGAQAEPSEGEQFLLGVLAQHTGAALGSARLRAVDAARAEQLHDANLALERSLRIHARLTHVATKGEGQEGLARGVHELTGFPVAIEDRFGNLRAWAGPDRPDPYPKDSRARRHDILRRAMRAGRPIREDGRLLSVASPRTDIIGVLVLFDPDAKAGEQELLALEHGTTVLAMELARLRTVVETELRVRRDLVEDLLRGAEDDSIFERAQALSYDLGGPHRVVILEGRERSGDAEVFFDAVRRAAQDEDVGSLLVARGTGVVLLARAEDRWQRLRSTVLVHLGGGCCRMGVGSRCDRPGDFPGSYRDAQLALKLQKTTKSREGITCFDDLGVYKVLAEVPHGRSEGFLVDWLGPLLDYDARKGSELVATLAKYLECSGNYDATADALGVHRSTFRYRLKRIREVSGYDLHDQNTLFNLQLATRMWQTRAALQG